MPQSKPAILVVDDEEVVLAALEQTLQREGYEVFAATDAIKALDEMSRRTFGVILTDQQMPQLTGLEFLARARAMQPDATRVLITGVLSLNTVIEAINTGEIYRFIVKPWLREELLASIHTAAQRYQMLRRNEALQAETERANAALEEQVEQIAAQNAELERLNSALQRNLSSSVQLCLKTLHAYWPVLGNQARRVQELCRVLASTLQLDEHDRQVLDIAALLHDIGLIEVPREILRAWQRAPEELSDQDRRLIEHHPVLGQELVGFVEHLEDVGRVIRAHHERWDGTGFPDRLLRENIPYLARLLAVALTYATYAPEHSALDFIKASAGTAFDPEAVRAFQRALPHATLPRRQREVLLSELRAGMVLAEGIYTSSGLLLVSEDQALSDTYIEKLRNHDKINPIAHSLVVYG